MGKKQTIAASRGPLVLCLVATAACSGEDPDPRAIAKSLFAAPTERSEPRPLEPVVASFGTLPTWSAPPAPLGETRPSMAPPPRHATMVVGHDARHAIDGRLQQAFFTSSGMQGAEAPCTDRDAIQSVLQRRADFAVTGSALSTRDQQAGLRQTRLGVELFALAVAAGSPVRSLTSSQVRKVLTGEIRNWNELGHAGGALNVYVPGDRSQAQRAAKVLIPGDPFAPSCLAMDADQVQRVLMAPDAIGVVRVGTTPPGPGVRLLQIDWSPATTEAYAFGTYPYGVPVTLVTAGQPAGAAKDFLAFARAAEGRELLGRSLLVTP